MVQRVSLETGLSPTIFRKRRFLGCVFSLPDGQRFEGLGNSALDLVNRLASVGQISSYALMPAATTQTSQNQPHFIWFVKTSQIGFKTHLISYEMWF